MSSESRNTQHTLLWMKYLQYNVRKISTNPNKSSTYFTSAVIVILSFMNEIPSANQIKGPVCAHQQSCHPFYEWNSFSTTRVKYQPIRSTVRISSQCHTFMNERNSFKIAELQFYLNWNQRCQKFYIFHPSLPIFQVAKKYVDILHLL